MIINKLGNKTYTTHELRYMAQDEIARLFSPSNEANLQRKLSGIALGLYTATAEELAEIDAYKNHLFTVQTETAHAEIDNQLLIDTIVYEQSLIRLQQYRLADGRAEQIVYKDDEIDFVIPAIEPLEATVEKTVYDFEGNATLEIVPNPLIVKDDDEREEAQSIIDNVSEEVLNLYQLRN